MAALCNLQRPGWLSILPSPRQALSSVSGQGRDLSGTRTPRKGPHQAWQYRRWFLTCPTEAVPLGSSPRTQDSFLWEPLLIPEILYSTATTAQVWLQRDSDLVIGGDGVFYLNLFLYLINGRGLFFQNCQQPKRLQSSLEMH